MVTTSIDFGLLVDNASDQGGGWWLPSIFISCRLAQKLRGRAVTPTRADDTAARKPYQCSGVVPPAPLLAGDKPFAFCQTQRYPAPPGTAGCCRSPALAWEGALPGREQALGPFPKDPAHLGKSSPTYEQ